MQTTTTNREELQTQLQHIIDHKTKPLGALGEIESLAMKLGLIQQTTQPNVSSPKAFIFGADHGVCEEGVNPFPQTVTEQMLANFAHGGAAMNVFCNTNDIPVSIVNMGIVNSNAEWDNVLNHAIAAGTKNFANEPAMSITQCETAIAVGQSLAREAVQQGHNLLMIGEMGIGNTTSASALLSAFIGLSPTESVGPGTGASPEQMNKKVKVIEKALLRCTAKTPIEVLAEVGGFEIAAMAGVLLSAKDLRVPVVVDGFISTVAAVFAQNIEPNAKDAWIFAHQSAEPAHTAMLDFLNATPLLQLGLRLGEGTGGALAYPIIKCAAAILNEMASFEDAGVSES